LATRWELLKAPLIVVLDEAIAQQDVSLKVISQQQDVVEREVPIRHRRAAPRTGGTT
jgi:hypothetical protein